MCGHAELGDTWTTRLASTYNVTRRWPFFYLKIYPGGDDCKKKK